MWPELDQLLRGDDDATVATPYTATVLEYWVVLHDETDTSLLDQSLSKSNGHSVYDAQHPCRYDKYLTYLFALTFRYIMYL